MTATTGSTHTFSATIENAGEGGAFVTIPFDVEGVFGKKRVKVCATINGEHYRGSLVRMGGPDHILVVRKDIRQKIGKSFGDEVEITLEEDTKPRTVTVPDDMAEALREHPEAIPFFESLSYSHRKEYINWIEEAKRPETRRRRIAKAMTMLTEKKKAK